MVRSSGVMALGTMASRVLGLVRSLALAYAIGTDLVSNTFSVANTVPNMIYLLLVGGVINAVFVPQLVRAARDPDGGEAYTDRLLTLTGASLLVITLLATVCAPLIIDLTYTDSPTGKPLAVLFAYWCLPQVFFYGVYTVLGQVLNARRVFGPMMWAPILNNVVSIVVCLLLIPGAIAPKDPTSISHGQAVLLGAGSTLGVVAQAAVLLPYLRRAGYSFRPRFDFRGYGLGKAMTLAKWTIGFVLVNQAAYVVVLRLLGSASAATSRSDTGHAARGVGATAYQSAYLFFILPHSVITVSIVTALLPNLSAAAAEGRRSVVRDQLSHALRLVGVAIVPCAAALVLLGPTLGKLLYAHGANTRANGTYIGLLLATFAFGLVPFACHHVLLRSFYAYEDTRTPFFIACVVSTTNAVLAVLVTPLLPVEWRTLGLAAVYSVTYWVALIVTANLAEVRLRGLDGTHIRQTYARLTTAAACGLATGGAALFALRAVLSQDNVLAELVTMLGAGLVLLVTYLAACAQMHVREVGQLVGALVPGAGRRPVAAPPTASREAPTGRHRRR